jgi:glycosyltransferase involved in cell wall biosynthesis
MKITRIPENYSDFGIELADPELVIGRQFPDFMIIGPWRTGTTWLSQVLRSVPGMFITTPKEPMYFSSLYRKQPNAQGDFLWYLDLFDSKHDSRHELLRGEASATYATDISVELIRFIAEINPNIKIVFGIRDPIERAWSHAKMNVDHRADEFRHLPAGDRIKSALGRHHIINAGYYRRHLEKWKSIIPKAQIHIFEYAKLQRSPPEALAEVCSFLGVPLTTGEYVQITDQVGKVGDTERWVIPTHIRKMLDRRYRSEINALRIQYNIGFPGPNPQDKARPLILVPRNSLEYSETFISNHIRGLDAIALSIREFMPLTLRKGTGMMVRLQRQLGSKRRLKSAIEKFEEYKGPILIEYGTTAAQMLPALRHLQRHIVVHFHGYDVYRTEVLAKYEQPYRELFNIADALVVVSEAMRTKLVQLGAPAEKIHLVVCGVDPALFAETDVSLNPPTFFACGRFVDKKAPHLTVSAFHQAWLKDPQIKLRMAGDGPLLESCKELVTKLELTEHVSFLEAVGQRTVARELQACRAFVQHSVVAPNGDSEGTPVGILEAGCTGVPVISTRHAGISDVVIEGRTGLLGAEGDVDHMAKSIAYLVSNPEEARRLGQNARNQILEHYTLEASIKKLHQILAAESLLTQ